MSRARVLADRANQNTLAVETDSSEVGISSASPRSTLDVRGEVQVGTTIQAGVAGVVTATSFSGSGANLTGLATTETVRTDTLTVAGVSTLTGAVNVDATTDSTSVTTGALIVDGGLGVAKNVYIGAGLSVAGTLTYEDVTSVDSVGLITAKSGVNVSGGQLQVGVAYSVGSAGVATALGLVAGTSGLTVSGATSGTTGDFSSNLTVGSGITMGSAGVATFSGTADIHLCDNVRLNVGDDNDFYIQGGGTGAKLHANNGVLELEGDSVQIWNAAANEAMAKFTADSSTELYFNNSKKFETTNNGTVTTGISTADGFSVGNGEFYKGFNNSGDSKIIGGYVSGSNTLRLGEALYLDDSGRLLVGNTSSEALFYTGSIQVQGTNSSTSAITVKSNQNDSGGPAIVLGKSRSGSAGGNTVVQSGDEFGCIYFNGADGTDTVSQGAFIRGSCDGTPGSNDMPGRLVFGTTADGQTTGTERLRITSAATFDFTNGALIEKVAITAGKLSDNTNIDLLDGMVHYFTTTETTTCTPNIRESSTRSVNDAMNTGDCITVTIITTAAAAAYAANITIDGGAVTENWIGGSAPSAGGSSGVDILTLNIIKTADATFTVLANQSKTS